jgi:ABC-type bacteriocin/lantibiotic exporter with double-glycine peptidase domain
MKPGCGTRCLLIACKRAGLEVDGDDLARMAGEENGLANLAGLARAARQVGFRARAEAWTVTELFDHGSALAGRTILHMHEDDGHFVLLAEVDREGVRVQDPTGLEKAKTRFTRDELARAWSGKVLVLRGAPGADAC